MKNIIIAIMLLMSSISFAQNVATPKRFAATVAIGGAVTENGQMIRIKSKLPRNVGKVFSNRIDMNNNLYCPEDLANIELNLSLYPNAVDWVMVCIHRGNFTSHARFMPGILLPDGRVVDPGTGNPYLSTVGVNGFYWAQVRHANSLKIKSANEIFMDDKNVASWDWRNFGLEAYYQGIGGYTVGGITAMRNGDVNGDGVIEGDDYRLWENFNNSVVGYNPVDVSGNVSKNPEGNGGGFDGFCDGSDLAVMKLHEAPFTNVEDLY